MSLTKSLLRSALEVTAGDRGLSFTQKWSEPMPCHLFFNILGFFIIFPLKKEYISTSLKKVFSDLAQSSFCPSFHLLFLVPLMLFPPLGKLFHFKIYLLQWEVKVGRVSNLLWKSSLRMWNWASHSFLSAPQPLSSHHIHLLLCSMNVYSMCQELDSTCLGAPKPMTTTEPSL